MALNFQTNRGWTAGKITPDAGLVTQVVAPPVSERMETGSGFQGVTNPNGTPAPANSPAFLQDAINKLLEVQKTGGTSGLEELLRKILGGVQQQGGFDPQIGQGYNAFQQAQAGFIKQQQEGLRASQMLQDKLLWNTTTAADAKDYDISGNLTQTGQRRQQMRSLMNKGLGAYGSVASAPVPGYASAPLPGWG